MSSKQEYINAVNSLKRNYDAFYMGNKYGIENTHEKEFKLLAKLKGDKVKNALAWIHDCYDCYYKNELEDGNVFDYLLEVIENEFCHLEVKENEC